MIRELITIFLLFVFAFNALGQTKTKKSKAEQLMEQIQKITATTDWMNEGAAESARKKIEKLTQEFTKETLDTPKNESTGNKNNFKQSNSSEAVSSDGISPVMTEGFMKELADKYAGSGDEYVDIFLADPIQEIIVEEYKEDSDLTPKNPEAFNSQEMVVIDVSLPQASVLIDLLKKYKSVKTLIITSSKSGAKADLIKILDYSKHLPLREFYAIHLRNSLTVIPDGLVKFENLQTIGFFDNAIKIIPDWLVKLVGLKNLYLDINPIASLPTKIGKFKNLEELGLGKTKISDEEISRVQKLLPNLKILTK